MKASDNGRLPANARQIMYGARPEIIDLTGKAQPWTNSAYFTQTLLPDFMDAHAELTAGWDVVFDARGHFAEPHTGEQFGIGTLEVRVHPRLAVQHLYAVLDIHAQARVRHGGALSSLRLCPLC